MRLTQTHRDAFVRAVLADTPQIDYKAQAQKIAQDYLIEVAPPAIVRAFKNPDTRHYFHQHRVKWTDNHSSYNSCYCFVVPNEGTASDYKFTDSGIVKKLAACSEAERKQEQERMELRHKLNATIKGFTTVKAARDAMPELAKYLPDPEAKQDRTVPAVTGLITDLMRAGWPKDQKKGKKPIVKEQ